MTLEPDSSYEWPIQSNILRNIDGEDSSNNEEFKIHVFIPDSFQGPPLSKSNPEADKNSKPKKKPLPHHIMIMVNGLAEYNSAVYLGKNGFCELFRQIGIATVFLPLPFHFNRLSDEDQQALAVEIEKKKAGDKTRFKHPDVEKLLSDPLRFYLGYEQIREDIEYVTERIDDSIQSGKLPPDTKISLWGFPSAGLVS